MNVSHKILNTGNEPLKINIYGNIDASKCVLLVGGTGDIANTFENLIKKLLSGKNNFCVVTFTFRGYESGNFLSFNQQVVDLTEVLATLKNFETLDLVCTSAGAFSSCVVLSANYKFENALFIDPADYYLSLAASTEFDNTWDGFRTYNPTEPTVSDYLPNIQGSVKVHVLNLTIRNCQDGKYYPIEERGIDHAAGHERVNNEMVKAFYEKAPIANRGAYVEENRVPHAFIRDGNISLNEEILAMHILKLLNL